MLRRLKFGEAMLACLLAFIGLLVPSAAPLMVTLLIFLAIIILGVWVVGQLQKIDAMAARKGLLTGTILPPDGYKDYVCPACGRAVTLPSDGRQGERPWCWHQDELFVWEPDGESGSTRMEYAEVIAVGASAKA